MPARRLRMERTLSIIISVPTKPSRMRKPSEMTRSSWPTVRRKAKVATPPKAPRMPESTRYMARWRSIWPRR
jgi:hypothetical protein